MNCAAELSEEKGYQEDYRLYSLVAKLAPEIIAKKRMMYKGVSANVDFYSGLVYRMLNLPCELYTPIFCNGAHCRLERPPSGGTAKCRQDHPTFLYRRKKAAGVYAAGISLISFHVIILMLTRIRNFPDAL